MKNVYIVIVTPRLIFILPHTTSFIHSFIHLLIYLEEDFILNDLSVYDNVQWLSACRSVVVVL